MTGTLKGYDQLLNLVLDEAVEFLRGKYYIVPGTCFHSDSMIYMFLIFMNFGSYNANDFIFHINHWNKMGIQDSGLDGNEGKKSLNQIQGPIVFFLKLFLFKKCTFNLRKMLTKIV